MLKLGYKASAEQLGPTELLQFSCLAEQSGFDSIFISDHFQPWKHHGGHAPFSFTWLGARYHPAVVAQAFRHSRGHVSRPGRARCRSAPENR